MVSFHAGNLFALLQQQSDNKKITWTQVYYGGDLPVVSALERLLTLQKNVVCCRLNYDPSERLYERWYNYLNWSD